MLLLKLCVFCLYLYGASGRQETVVELTDDDFETGISEHEIVLVMFYAPWCGHCKNFKPEYEKAAKILFQNNVPVSLVKVDCTGPGKTTCEKYDIGGFPTLKIFENGDFSHDYGGTRDAQDIVKYLTYQAGPSAKEIKSVEELENFLLEQRDVCVVGLFEKESELKNAFLKVATRMRQKAKFAFSILKPILEARAIADGFLLFRPYYLHNKFENHSIPYSGPAVIEEMESFINQNYHGLVGYRKRDNVDDFKNLLVIAYYEVDYVKNPKGTNYWRNRILKVAKQYEGKVNFAISSKKEFGHELDEYGVDYAAEKAPIVVATNNKNERTVMKDEFSVEALNQFVGDFIKDNMEPYAKIEEKTEL